MNIREAYAHWAETYDSDENLTRDLDAVVTRAHLKDFRCDTAIELGCGTGKNTAFLSRICKRVVALDFSQEMIRKAQRKVTGLNVLFTVTDIKNMWPCRAQSADLVTCNLVLEHVSELHFVFQEAARTLVSNGRLLISELHPYRQYAGKRASFRTTHGSTEIPAFLHNISDFLESAVSNSLELRDLREWWHKADKDKLPRLISFVFVKRSSR